MAWRVSRLDGAELPFDIRCDRLNRKVAIRSLADLRSSSII